MILKKAADIAEKKGYTPKGLADKVYHLHIRYEGDNSELYFRDHLNEHPEVAKEYERLKPDMIYINMIVTHIHKQKHNL